MNFTKRLEKDIRLVPNFPKEGIMFRDITTLLNDAKAFGRLIKHLKKRYKKYDLDFIVGIESRGFIFAASLAASLKIGFVPIRKKGKLPADTFSQDCELEYGTATLEIHKDAFRNKSKAKVLLIDDLIATAGTAEAAIKLINKAGAKVSEACFIIELSELQGVKKLKDTSVYSILKI